MSKNDKDKRHKKQKDKAKDKSKDKSKDKVKGKDKKNKADGKAKTKASKSSTAVEEMSAAVTPMSAATAATYADGSPLDRITYLEAKLILKPDRFNSVESFRNFGKLVQETAKRVGVGFVADRETGLRLVSQRNCFHRHGRFPSLQQCVHPAPSHLLPRRISGRRSRGRFQVSSPRRSGCHRCRCAAEDRR